MQSAPARPAPLILIVDDDDDIREVLVEVLVEAGYRAMAAANGQMALDVLRANAELPAVVILDLMMPGVDGFAFRDAQRRDPALADVPVVVLTAAGETIRQRADFGARAVLRKPIRLDELLAIVRDVAGVPAAASP